MISVTPATGSPTPQPPDVSLGLDRKMRHTWNLMRWHVRATAVFKMLKFGGSKPSNTTKVHPALARDLESATQQQRLKSFARLRQAIGDTTITNGEEAKNLQSMMESRYAKHLLI